MNRTLRCVAAVALALFAGLSSMTSCAQQGEGERCDLDKGLTGTDSDCGDGLTCTDPSTLQHSPAAAVCCPSDGTFTTIVCTPKQGGSSSSTASGTGAGGATTTAGSGGQGGTSTATAGGAGGTTATAGSGGATTTAGSGGQGGTSTATTGGAGGSGGA